LNSHANDRQEQTSEAALSSAQAESEEKLLMEMPGVSSLLGETTSLPGGRHSEVGALVAGSVADIAKAFFDLRAAGLRSSQIRPFVETFFERPAKLPARKQSKKFSDKFRP
jgi:hypothetical protein